MWQYYFSSKQQLSFIINPELDFQVCPFPHLSPSLPQPTILTPHLLGNWTRFCHFYLFWRLTLMDCMIGLTTIGNIYLWSQERGWPLVNDQSSSHSLCQYQGIKLKIENGHKYKYNSSKSTSRPCIFLCGCFKQVLALNLSCSILHTKPVQQPKSWSSIPQTSLNKIHIQSFMFRFLVHLFVMLHTVLTPGL